jgi:hypothetical protein
MSAKPAARDDLSFTRRNGRGGLINWSAPQEVGADWDTAAEQGRARFAEVAALAEVDELEAACAVKFALNEHSWQGGRGVEWGFSEALANVVVVGLRAIRAGAFGSFDLQAETAAKFAAAVEGFAAEGVDDPAASERSGDAELMVAVG